MATPTVVNPTYRYLKQPFFQVCPFLDDGLEGPTFSKSFNSGWNFKELQILVYTPPEINIAPEN